MQRRISTTRSPVERVVRGRYEWRDGGLQPMTGDRRTIWKLERLIRRSTNDGRHAARTLSRLRARGAAHRPQSNSPAAPRSHHPTHQQESRQAARVYEGAARVGEERDQQPGYHSELTQSTKSRACAGQADVGAVLKQRRWVPRGRGVR